jgi:polyisoprenyl-teichoic acid--peptidoglycan teichoic acid transferase
MSRLVKACVVATVAIGMVATAGLAAERFLRAPLDRDDPIVFLLLGGDEGPPRSGTPLRSRADGIQLLVVNPELRKATFMSVPRDSWVPVPGRGTTRINACLVGGPDPCVQAVEALWGIEVDHYLLTSMEGFKQGIAAFGGIWIDVEHTVSDGGSNVTETGFQRLTGSQSLTYARDRRNRPGGDFGRTAAQADLLRAAHRNLWDDRASIAQILEAVAAVQKSTVTDMSADELIRYAFLAMTMDPDDVAQVTLPARVGMAGTASVVFLTDEAHAIVHDVTADGVLSR